MTNIKFSKKGQHYISLSVTGHTGYAKQGQDILCSAVSTISQSLSLGVLKVLKVKAKYQIDENSGMLKLELPKTLDDQTLTKTDLLFETAYVSFQDLKKGYSKFINMEVEDVY